MGTNLEDLGCPLKVKVLAAWSCPTLCNPMDWNPPGSSVLGIFQARILEWIAISYFKDLPDPGIEPKSPALQVDSLLLSHQGSPLNKQGLVS